MTNSAARTARPEIEAALIRAQTHWKKEASKGRIYDTPRLALRDASLFRGGQSRHDSQQGLRLEFARVSYVDQRAATTVFREVLNDNGRREILSRSESDGKIDQTFSNCFGVTLAIITSDDKILFAKRSHRVAVNAGRFVCGVVEGMGDQDFAHDKPDPFQTALRGLHEEFGIVLSRQEAELVRLTALVLDEDYYEWGMIGSVDFRGQDDQKFHSRKLMENLAIAEARDKFETDDTCAIPFRPDEIAIFLSAYDVVNYAVVCAVLALLSESGYSTVVVERAFRRHYRRSEATL